MHTGTQKQRSRAMQQDTHTDEQHFYIVYVQIHTLNINTLYALETHKAASHALSLS